MDWEAIFRFINSNIGEIIGTTTVGVVIWWICWMCFD